jgi:hypothetical protein
MLFYKRLYLILRDKLLAKKIYINKHLNKGFIYLSIFFIVAPILLTKKPGEVFNFILTIEGLTLL